MVDLLVKYYNNARPKNYMCIVCVCILYIHLFSTHLSKLDNSVYVFISSGSTSKTSEPKKPAVKSESLKRMLRRKRSSRKRRKQRVRGGERGRKVLKVRTPSEASSPGRSTPSPDSLARICLYWEKQLTSPDYYIPPSDSEESE